MENIIKTLEPKARKSRVEIKYWDLMRVDEMVAAADWQAHISAVECAKLALVVTADTAFNDTGHICCIHPTNGDLIRQVEEEALVGRIMVNQPQYYGNGDKYGNGMPFTLTLGCGSWGNDITTENIHWNNFLKISWVSKPIELEMRNKVIYSGAH